MCLKNEILEIERLSLVAIFTNLLPNQLFVELSDNNYIQYGYQCILLYNDFGKVLSFPLVFEYDKKSRSYKIYV